VQRTFGGGGRTREKGSEAICKKKQGKGGTIGADWGKEADPAKSRETRNGRVRKSHSRRAKEGTWERVKAKALDLRGGKIKGGSNRTNLVRGRAL